MHIKAFLYTSNLKTLQYQCKLQSFAMLFQKDDTVRKLQCAHSTSDHQTFFPHIRNLYAFFFTIISPYSMCVMEPKKQMWLSVLEAALIIIITHIYHKLHFFILKQNCKEACKLNSSYFVYICVCVCICVFIPCQILLQLRGQPSSWHKTFQLCNSHLYYSRTNRTFQHGDTTSLEDHKKKVHMMFSNIH